ncbi:MAG: DNA/RNA nuclease SfsA [Candidatus Krumholzibacteriota bacterium]
MEFPARLVSGRFLRREKRFFIHAVLDDGTKVVAHTNNTGRMSGCLAEGARVWLSPANNPERKLKWSLEIVEAAAVDGEGRDIQVMVGVNTALANRLVAEAITAGMIPGLAGFESLRTEVRYGSRNSRIDILLESGEKRVWVEVKNVSLVEGGHARFPDAPTERGRKHLLELQEMVSAGDRAALVFCIQREDAVSVGPADDIDPQYGHLLRKAAVSGVEIHGLASQVNPQAINSERQVAVDLTLFNS